MTQYDWKATPFYATEIPPDDPGKRSGREDMGLAPSLPPATRDFEPTGGNTFVNITRNLDAWNHLRMRAQQKLGLGVKDPPIDWDAVFSASDYMLPAQGASGSATRYKKIEAMTNPHGQSYPTEGRLSSNVEDLRWLGSPFRPSPEFNQESWHRAQERMRILGHLDHLADRLEKLRQERERVPQITEDQ